MAYRATALGYSPTIALFLEEGSGSTMDDDSGNGYGGSYSGTYSHVSAIETSLAGAVSFGGGYGTSASVGITNNDNCVEVVIETGSDVTTQQVVAHFGSDLTIYISGGTVYVVWDRHNTYLSGSVSANTKYHISCGKIRFTSGYGDGDRGKLYINGSLADSTTAYVNTSSINSTSTWSIARSDGTALDSSESTISAGSAFSGTVQALTFFGGGGSVAVADVLDRWSEIVFASSGVSVSGAVTDGSDSVSGAADVVVSASGSVTDGTDTVSGDSQVVVGVSGSVTDGSDSVSGTVAHETPIEVSASITDGSDTVSGSSAVIVSASAAVTDGQDSVSGSSDVDLDVSASVTDGSDAITGSASVVVSVSSSVTDGQDTVSGSATTSPSVSAAIVDGSDSVSASATVEVDLSAAVTDGADSVSGTSTVLVQASASITDGSDTVSGSVGHEALSVSASITDGQDIVSGSSTVTVHVSSAVTDGSDTISGSAALIGEVSGSITDGLDSVTGSVTQLGGVSASIVDGQDTISGSAAVTVQASASITDGSDSVSGTAETPADAPVFSMSVDFTSITLSLGEPAIGAVSYSIRYGLSTGVYDPPVTGLTESEVLNFAVFDPDDGVDYFAQMGASNGVSTTWATEQSIRTFPGAPTLSNATGIDATTCRVTVAHGAGDYVVGTLVRVYDSDDTQFGSDYTVLAASSTVDVTVPAGSTGYYAVGETYDDNTEYSSASEGLPVAPQSITQPTFGTMSPEGATVNVSATLDSSSFDPGGYGSAYVIEYRLGTVTGTLLGSSTSGSTDIAYTFIDVETVEIRRVVEFDGNPLIRFADSGVSAIVVGNLIEVSGSVTDGSDIVTGSVSQLSGVSASITDGQDSVSGSFSAIVAVSSSVVDGSDSVSGSVTGQSGVSATIVDGQDSVSASASVLLVASGSVTDGQDSVSGQLLLAAIRNALYGTSSNSGLNGASSQLALNGASSTASNGSGSNKGATGSASATHLTATVSQG